MNNTIKDLILNNKSVFQTELEKPAVEEAISIIEDTYPNDFKAHVYPFLTSIINPNDAFLEEYDYLDGFQFEEPADTYDSDFHLFSEIEVPYASNEGMARGKDAEPGYTDIGEEVSIINDAIKSAFDKIYSNHHNLAQVKNMSNDKAYEITTDTTIAFKAVDVINMLSLEEMKKDPQKVLHLVGHFKEEDNDEIFEFLMNSGISQADVEKEFAKPGSKIDGNIEEFFQRLQDSVKVITSQMGVIKTNQLILSFQDNIGTSSVVETEGIEDVRKIKSGKRIGFNAVYAKDVDNKTNQVLLALGADKEGKPMLKTIIPGAYAPPAPLQYNIESLKSLQDDIKSKKKNVDSDINFYSEVFGNAAWCPPDIKEGVYDKAKVLEELLDEDGMPIGNKYDIDDVLQRLIEFNTANLQDNPRNDAIFACWENLAFVYDDVTIYKQDTRQDNDSKESQSIKK